MSHGKVRRQSRRRPRERHAMIRNATVPSWLVLVGVAACADGGVSESGFPGLPSEVTPGGQTLPASVLEASAGKDKLTLHAPQGLQTAVVRLTTPSVVDTTPPPPAGLVTPQPRTFAPNTAAVIAQQAAFMSSLPTLAPSAVVVAQLRSAMNALVLQVDAGELAAIANHGSVAEVALERSYAPALEATVPFVGGNDLQVNGFDGRGIRVAIMDSGIDYHHANLGGSGDPAVFSADDPTTLDDGGFPNSRIVGGYDFVGDAWPEGPVMPDPDPIDANGHGTFIADIVGGPNGVAPAVELYAAKVCSENASGRAVCSFAAALQAFEYLMDPNGDGDTSDRIHVINMSFSKAYGRSFHDAFAVAADNMTKLGVIVVATSGNLGGRPFITASGAVGDGVISVAATEPVGEPGALASEAFDVAQYSSRGPRFDDAAIKPEIIAPGTMNAAQVGTGVGVTSLSGTSFAAPIIAAGAALLLEARPELRPADIKNLLMSTGETNLYSSATGDLAPISLVGGGLVRLGNALEAPVVASVEGTRSAGLSFGLHDVRDDQLELERTVILRNASPRDVTYAVSSTFRRQNDADSGAVSVAFESAEVMVEAGDATSLDVRLVIDGTKLHASAVNSGEAGGDTAALTLNEYDGYIVLQADDHRLTLPWHVLPQPAAEVSAESNTFKINADGKASVVLENEGAGASAFLGFGLVATSPDLPSGNLGSEAPTPDLQAFGYRSLPNTGCAAGFEWGFGFALWESVTHLAAVEAWVLLDIDQDGAADYYVSNSDIGDYLGQPKDGRHLTAVYNIATETWATGFFAVHGLNSANISLWLCGDLVGLTSADIASTNVDIEVGVDDVSFDGPGDVLDEVITITPGGEQFIAVANSIPADETDRLEVIDYGAHPGNSPMLGVLVFTDHFAAATAQTETLILRPE